MQAYPHIMHQHQVQCIIVMNEARYLQDSMIYIFPYQMML